MAPNNAGDRIITDISQEPPAIQDAYHQALTKLEQRRAAEDAQLAEVKARAVAAVEEAITLHNQHSSRLAI